MMTDDDDDEDDDDDDDGSDGSDALLTRRTVARRHPSSAQLSSVEFHVCGAGRRSAGGRKRIAA